METMNSESDEKSDSHHEEFALDIGDEFLEDEEENGFVEWEEEEGEKREKNDQSICTNVDWDAGKRKRRRLSKDEKKRNLLLHQSHLILYLAAATEWHANSCSHNVLRALLSSLVPADLWNQNQAIAAKLHNLCRFYNQHFSLVKTERNVSSDLCGEEMLLHAFSERKATKIAFHLLFLVLCRSIGYYCRLVVALDAYQIDLKASEDIVLRDPESDTYAPIIWIEVWNSDTHWISCDVAKNIISEQHHQEILSNRSISYILSIDQISGFAVDVTARYVHSWSKTLQLRHGHQFISKLVEAHNQQILETTTKYAPILAQIEQEKKELQELADAERMPTSIEGFRRHHRYCLERHLGRLEVLYPRQVIGIFKGQRVYLRCHIQKLQSARHWLRQGRVIKEDEKLQPYKKLNRNKDTRNGCDDRQSRDIALYGGWQTEDFAPSIVMDGILPKNEHGNIELWSDKHLPVGAAHLRMPHITAAASKLGIDYAPALVGFETKNGINYPKFDVGIDYAPALVGFETKNGISYPKFDGIIVALSHKQLLIDAHAHLEQRKIEHAIEQNQNLIHKRWKRLVQRMLIRSRLEKDYGKV
ncbi:unnamed protein product [Albugo candida]|uniref:Rad4 beta-hairpin domain-containing protein n=1 Tax=Albugo candida TaxID=65357 RepID=A0A024GPM1_9STRA|nr:unnamed protein product [Albugo candida]|eukprot:CCI48302.1 unnamed protein product [Albugo candida]